MNIQYSVFSGDGTGTRVLELVTTDREEALERADELLEDHEIVYLDFEKDEL